MLRPTTDVAIHPRSDSAFGDHAVMMSSASTSTTGPVSSTAGPRTKTATLASLVMRPVLAISDAPTAARSGTGIPSAD